MQHGTRKEEADRKCFFFLLFKPSVLKEALLLFLVFGFFFKLI